MVSVFSCDFYHPQNIEDVRKCQRCALSLPECRRCAQDKHAVA